MASSLGPMPTAQQMAGSCLGICYRTMAVIVAILAVICAIIWALVSWGNVSIEDHIIGKAPIAPKGEMQVGYQHDGDLSYDYYVRIVGGATTYSEWTRFGSDLNALGRCQFATSADGRFTCIYSHEPIRSRVRLLSDTMPLIVIHDRNSGMIWPTEQSDNHFLSFWLGAWRNIRLTNPDVPSLPD